MNLFSPKAPSSTPPRDKWWDSKSMIPLGIGWALLGNGLWNSYAPENPVGNVDSSLNEIVRSWRQGDPYTLEEPKVAPSRLTIRQIDELQEILDKYNSFLSSLRKHPDHINSSDSIRQYEVFKQELITFTTTNCPEGMRGYVDTEVGFETFLTDTLPRTLFQRGVKADVHRVFLEPLPSDLPGFNVRLSLWRLTESSHDQITSPHSSTSTLSQALRRRVERLPVSHVYESTLIQGAAEVFWKERNPQVRQVGSAYIDQKKYFSRLAQLVHSKHPEVALELMVSSIASDNADGADISLYQEILRISRAALQELGLHLRSDQQVEVELAKLLDARALTPTHIQFWQEKIRSELWIDQAQPQGAGLGSSSPFEDQSKLVGAFFLAAGLARRRNRLNSRSIWVREPLGSYPNISLLDLPLHLPESDIVRTIPTEENWGEKVNFINRMWQNRSERIGAEYMIVGMWGLDQPIRNKALWCMSSLRIVPFYTFRFVILLPSKIEGFASEDRAQAREALADLQFHIPYYKVDPETRLRGLAKLEEIARKDRNTSDEFVQRVVTVVQYLVSEDFKLRRRVERAENLTKPASGDL